MADWGMKVASDGNSVSGADSGLILTSKYSPVKVILSNTVTVSIPANQLNSTDLSAAIPYSSVNPTQVNPRMIAFATIGGKAYRNNLNSGESADYFFFNPYTVDYPASQFQRVYFNISRTTSSSTYPGAIDIPVRYYLVVVNFNNDNQ